MTAINCIFESASDVALASRLLDDLSRPPQPVFQKSALGATAKTFLPLNYGFKWVVKWQSPPFCQVELLATQLFRLGFQHLSVPRPIYVLDSRLTKVIRGLFKNHNIPVTDHFLLLELKQGNTLAQFYIQRHYRHLSKEGLHDLFRVFGVTAGGDFLIGNTDRFIPVGLPACLDKKHQANGGNVLIELPKNELPKVHAIDTGPNVFYFFDMAERKEGSEDVEENSVFNLFDDAPQEAAAAAPSSRDCSFTQAREQGKEYRQERMRDFQYFMRAHDDELQRLAQKIVEGIKNAWLKAIRDPTVKGPVTEWMVELEDFFVPENGDYSLCDDVKRGLLEARKVITDKRIDLLRITNDLERSADGYSPLTRIFLKFVKDNLGQL